MSFLKLRISDSYTIGLLNPRHILIFFTPMWYIEDYLMCVFKWTHDFHVLNGLMIFMSTEILIFHNLPMPFSSRKSLFFLGSLFGIPHRLGSATSLLKRPSVARLQVEINLLKQLPQFIWIGTNGNHGVWQKVEVDREIPLYCQYCWHVGHSEVTCTVKHPELKQVPKLNTSEKMEYRIKAVRPSTLGLTAREKSLIPSIKNVLTQKDQNTNTDDSMVLLGQPVVADSERPFAPGGKSVGHDELERPVLEPAEAAKRPISHVLVRDTEFQMLSDAEVDEVIIMEDSRVQTTILSRSASYDNVVSDMDFPSCS